MMRSMVAGSVAVGRPGVTELISGSAYSVRHRAPAAWIAKIAATELLERAAVRSGDAATALTLASGSAFAAPSDDARTHFQAIASGDTQIVMRAYADQAQLNWVGGPLDGTYATTDAIRGTWEKFGKAVGPLKLTVGQIEESANPKGATVSANVVFEGKMPIKVRYVLTFREGKIVSETWQIDPKLAVAAAY